MAVKFSHHTIRKGQKFVLKIVFLSAATVVLLRFVFIKGDKKWGKVCYKNNCFDVELALTPMEQTAGLMFRKKLDLNRGMLFAYKDEQKHSFWMKNTFIPLDIIWINKDKEIVFIHKNSQPCKDDFCPSVSSPAKAKYIFEINGGVSEKIGLKEGEKLIIKMN